MSRYPETRNLTVYLEFAGATWDCEVSYNPGYEAPNCSNHDDPRFSDPGEDPSLELVSAKLEGTNYELCESELDDLYEMFESKLYDLANDAYNGGY